MDFDTLRKALHTKARAEADSTGKHVKYYANIGGVPRLVTLMSHGGKGQISKGLLSQMARQMRLTGRQLGQFVDCTLSREEWVEAWEMGS